MHRKRADVVVERSRILERQCARPAALGRHLQSPPPSSADQPTGVAGCGQRAARRQLAHPASPVEYRGVLCFGRSLRQSERADRCHARSAAIGSGLWRVEARQRRGLRAQGHAARAAARCVGEAASDAAVCAGYGAAIFIPRCGTLCLYLSPRPHCMGNRIARPFHTPRLDEARSGYAHCSSTAFDFPRGRPARRTHGRTAPQRRASVRRCADTLGAHQGRGDVQLRFAPEGARAAFCGEWARAPDSRRPPARRHDGRQAGE